MGDATVFSIVITEKGGTERRETFDQGEVTIGRVQGNDLMLPKGNVSKRHCRLERTEGGFVVADQNSTNGTYVNRRRITQATAVREGDRIYIGDFVLRLELGEAPAPHQASPADLIPEVPAEPVDEEWVEPEPSQPVNRRRTRQETAVEVAQPSVSTDELASAVRLLIERVTSKIDARLLDRDLSSETRDRVRHALNDVYRQLQTEGGGFADEARAKSAALAELLDLGPLGGLLDDPSVSEISASGASFISVTRGSERRTDELSFCSPHSVERVIARLCRSEGQPLGEGEWLVRRELPSMGFELEALRAPLSPSGAVLRLRRRDRVFVDLDGLVQLGTISRTIAVFLRHCIFAKANILVVGQRRSGVGALASALCAAAERERILVLPDEAELASAGESLLELRQNPEVPLEQLLVCAGSFPDHRLVVDGFGGERGLATLRAICAGAEGTIACVRARSIERALGQFCAEVALAHPGLSAGVVADAVVASFDVAIEVARLRDGRSRVLRLCELRRGESPLVVGEDIFEFTIERTATGGTLEGSFHATGRSPLLSEELRARGARMDPSLFTRSGEDL